jgi:hypothetical protein
VTVPGEAAVVAVGRASPAVGCSSDKAVAAPLTPHEARQDVGRAVGGPQGIVLPSLLEEGRTRSKSSGSTIGSWLPGCTAPRKGSWPTQVGLRRTSRMVFGVQRAPRLVVRQVSLSHQAIATEPHRRSAYKDRARGHPRLPLAEVADRRNDLIDGEGVDQDKESRMTFSTGRTARRPPRRPRSSPARGWASSAGSHPGNQRCRPWPWTLGRPPARTPIGPPFVQRTRCLQA